MNNPIKDDPNLKREVIMDHYEYPRNHHLVSDCRYCKVHMASDSCVDDIHVQALIEDGIIKSFEAIGGCNGNLKTIPLLLDGWTVDQIEAKLSGIICRRRPTSCSDQLAKAVRAGYIASKDPDYKAPLDEE